MYLQNKSNEGREKSDFHKRESIKTLTKKTVETILLEISPHKFQVFPLKSVSRAADVCNSVRII